MKKIFVFSVACLILVSVFGGFYLISQYIGDTRKEPTISGSEDKSESIETSITREDPMPVLSKKIDGRLRQELESNNYTFEQPLVVLDPYQNSPLTALALFNTKESYSVRVTVKGDNPTDNIVGNLDANTQHRVPIIGLYPGRENTVLLELLDNKGNVVSGNEIKVQTDSLPSSMENMVTPVSVTEESAYGLIEVSGQDTPYPFAFDSTGTVRWYLSIKTDGYGMFPLSDNRYMVIPHGTMIQTISKPFTAEMYEMDHLGRVYQVYYVENGVHHDISEKIPGGNLFVLSSSNDNHIEDMVQEIDRETGAIVKSLVMTEIFDKTYVDMEDWAHLNTVSYDADTDTVLLSPRNVHSGIKVDWKTNKLIWILGDERFWEGTPFEDKVLKGIGDIIWHYQPHSIYEITQDLDHDPNTMHVMMFDNHWHKTRKVDFFDNNENSFVSIYNINEKDMTVSQLHTYPGVKSKITSNSLYDHEDNRIFFMGGYLDPVNDGNNGMIYEYDYETEKALNQYALKYTFYRGYELTVDYNLCAKPLDIGTNYMKGVIRAPEVTKNKLIAPDENIEEGVSFLLKDTVIYMNSADHTVSQVEFIGDKNTYLVDYTENGKGAKTYKKLVYNIPIPISGLKADTYQIIVNYDGTRYKTGETITIQ